MTEARNPLQLAPSTLGEALRLLRHRAHVSRDELARSAGISAGAVSNYENDVSDPAASTLRRLCSALARPLSAVPAIWEQLGAVLDQSSDAHLDRPDDGDRVIR